MPLVRIAYRSGKGSGFGRAVGESVHRAMVETINVPAKDVFQITLNAGRAWRTDWRSIPGCGGTESPSTLDRARRVI